MLVKTAGYNGVPTCAVLRGPRGSNASFGYPINGTRGHVLWQNLDPGPQMCQKLYCERCLSSLQKDRICGKIERFYESKHTHEKQGKLTTRKSGGMLIAFCSSGGGERQVPQ